jgi:hypothetical protein
LRAHSQVRNARMQRRFARTTSAGRRRGRRFTNRRFGLLTSPTLLAALL